MAAATRLLFNKDDGRKSFGMSMLPKLKDLKGKLHGLNFPKVRRDSKSPIPVISVIPPTPKTQKSLTAPRDIEVVTKQLCLLEEDSGESNNNDVICPTSDNLLEIRRVCRQRRYSEPIVLSETDGCESSQPESSTKDFLKVPRRKPKKKRRKTAMKKSMSADDIVTLEWLATNSVIDHGVAQFCSDGNIIDLHDDIVDQTHDLINFMSGDCHKPTLNSTLLESRTQPYTGSKPNTELSTEDEKKTFDDKPSIDHRSVSYHNLLYDFDFASSYQIYQPTVYDVDEESIFSRNTPSKLRNHPNRNSLRFRKAFDQGQVYFDNIVDMIKTKAEHLEVRKSTSLPVGSPPLSISSNIYILSK